MAAATTSLLKSSPLRVFTGNAHPALAARICHELGVPLSPAKVSTFKNGEISVIVLDSVRDCDVFLINPTCRRGGDPMYVRWRASCERLCFHHQLLPKCVLPLPPRRGHPLLGPRAAARSVFHQLVMFFPSHFLTPHDVPLALGCPVLVSIIGVARPTTTSSSSSFSVTAAGALARPASPWCCRITATLGRTR